MSARDYRIVAFEGIDGAGKSVLTERLATALRPTHSVLTTRLSPYLGRLMRTLVDEPTGGKERYQDVVPGDFRYATYVIEAVVQFRYLHAEYSRHDFVLFDRWLQTYDCYCDHPTVHRQWYERLRSAVPAPDALFYLRLGPQAAADRVRSRGDWTADNWPPERLLADLRRRYDCYERVMADAGAVVVDAEQDEDTVLSSVLDALDLVGTDREAAR